MALINRDFLSLGIVHSNTPITKPAYREIEDLHPTVIWLGRKVDHRFKEHRAITYTKQKEIDNGDDAYDE